MFKRVRAHQSNPTTTFEVLWRRLLTALEQRYDPFDESMTPAEIALEVAASVGDRRVSQFVWDYYYPRLYGQTNGLLSDSVAERLIVSLEKRKPAGADASLTVSTPVLPHCSVCGRTALT